MRAIFSDAPALPVKDDEGGHHGDVQHEDDDDDDDERAVRAADVSRVAVVAAAVLGREVGVARRLGVGSALGEVTRALNSKYFLSWFSTTIAGGFVNSPYGHPYNHNSSLPECLAGMASARRPRRR